MSEIGDLSRFDAARSIEGRTAIITGAGSGIGRATSDVLAMAGANVVVTDINAAAAHNVVKSVLDQGFSASALALDVTDPEQIGAVVRHAVATYGGVDLLVNNAGINRKTAPGDAAFGQAWDDSLAVMLDGPQKLITAALDHLKASDCARIVNIASIEGLANSAGNAPYAAAKAGILGLTRALAVDLGPYGITVNAICPGPVLTGMTQHLPQSFQDQYLERYTALKRPGLPEDIAHMVLSICLPSAGFMTGASVVVDGGLMARSS